MLRVGIVGLPNVGKSTLFNALTRTRKAEACNYPFCTIEPNVGIVEVPDERLQFLQKMVNTSVVIPAAIEFVDIAGLVKGASRGEGLGNKFLGNIREVDAIVHVVRCFQDSNILHSLGSVDAIRDIEIINTELILADLESAQSQLDKQLKRAKSMDKEAIANAELLKRIVEHLNQGNPVLTMEFDEKELPLLKQYSLLTSKPVIYACNVAENELADASQNPQVQAIKKYVTQRLNSSFCCISARVEEELGELSLEEAREFLNDLGVKDSGVSELIRRTYDLLGLASYFTAGEKEVRAWTFKKGMKAPACAGIIHGDFEKGFIKAEVVSYEDLVKYKDVQGAKHAGRYRLEGKEYEFQDGDVAVFRFN